MRSGWAARRAQTRVTFHEYATEWVERYQGCGRGFRESTRADYRRYLRRHAFHHFGERKRVVEITPRDVANFVGWLCDEREQGVHRRALTLQAMKGEQRSYAELRRVAKNESPPPTRRLDDKSVRNIVGPLRACLATAVREGIIRHNPARDVALPHRPQVKDEDDEHIRVFTRDQLAAFIATVHPRHRLLFRFLAATGMRWSELAAIRWRDLKLDGSEPHVKVRRALVRGQVHPPKSRYGRRNVPLGAALVFDLRQQRRASEWPGDDDLVFTSEAGTPLHHSNLHGRIVRPVAEEVGAPWAGFHTFRHTCASLLFARGANAVQVQRWLGHHSAAFTLATYVHLLGESVGDPLDLDAELAGGNRVATQATKTSENADTLLAADRAA